MKKYIWSLLMIIFTALPAWADGIVPHYYTFLLRATYFTPATTTLIVLSYILFAFISFWAFYPLYKKQKKKLLAISLIFPILVYVPFIWVDEWRYYMRLIYIALLLCLFTLFVFALFKKKWRYFFVYLTCLLLYALFLVVFDYADNKVEDIDYKKMQEARAQEERLWRKQHEEEQHNSVDDYLL